MTRLYVRGHRFPPVTGRLLRFCDPSRQTIADLADALLASRSEQLVKMRSGIDPIVEKNPLATVPSTHTRILAKHPDVIIAVLEAVAAKS